METLWSFLKSYLFISTPLVFQLQNISDRERGKADFNCSTHRLSHPLSFLFTLFETHAAPDRIKAQPRRLLFSSLTNFDSKKTQSKADLSPLCVSGRHSHAGLCHVFQVLPCENRSVGRSSPATLVYIPLRQTPSLPSGEKLSTSVLIWLCVHCVWPTLENCTRRQGWLFLFFFFFLVTGPWTLLPVAFKVWK